MLPNLTKLSLEEPERRAAPLDASIPCDLFNKNAQEAPPRQEQAYARFEQIRDNNNKIGAGDDASLEQAAKRTKPDEEAQRKANEARDALLNEQLVPRTWLTQLNPSKPDDDGRDPILLTELANGFVGSDNEEAWGDVFDVDFGGARIEMPVPALWQRGPSSIVALSDPAACNEGANVEYMLKASLFMQLATQFRSNFDLSFDNRLRFPEHFYNPFVGTQPSNFRSVLTNSSACFYNTAYGRGMLDALLQEARQTIHTFSVGEGPPTAVPLLAGEYQSIGDFSGPPKADTPPRRRADAPAAPVAIPEWLRGPVQSAEDKAKNPMYESSSEGEDDAEDDEDDDWGDAWDSGSVRAPLAETLPISQA
mgnify:CR=1 FL=1